MLANKPKVRIHLCFTPHHARKDFDLVKVQVDRIKPDVFCMEAGNLTKDEKTEYLMGLHEDIGIIRKIRSDRKSMVENWAEVNFPSHPEYGAAVMKTLVESTPPMFLYTLEANDTNLGDAWKKEYRQLSNRVQYYLMLGNLSKALESSEKAINNYDNLLIIRRNEAIIANMATLGEELAAYYPSLQDKDTIRVLAPFGPAHTAVFHNAKKKFAGSDCISIDASFQPVRFGPMEFIARAQAYGKKTDEEWFAQVIPYNLIDGLMDNVYGKKIYGKERDEVLDMIKLLDKRELRKIFQRHSFSKQKIEKNGENLDMMMWVRGIVTDFEKITGKKLDFIPWET